MTVVEFFAMMSSQGLGDLLFSFEIGFQGFSPGDLFCVNHNYFQQRRLFWKTPQKRLRQNLS